MQLKDIVHQIGFFYIRNFALSRMNSTGNSLLGKKPPSSPEENLKYGVDLEAEPYHGHPTLRAIEILPGLRDNVEFYKVFKVTPQYERKHVDVIKRNFAKIERFPSLFS